MFLGRGRPQRIWTWVRTAQPWGRQLKWCRASRSLCLCSVRGRGVAGLDLLLFYWDFFLFLAVLGLHCCFSTCSECVPLSVWCMSCSLRRPVLLQSTRPRCTGLSFQSCNGHLGTTEPKHWLVVHGLSLCELFWPGIEPTSPALAGRFSTTGPPGKSLIYTLMGSLWH